MTILRVWEMLPLLLLTTGKIFFVVHCTCVDCMLFQYCEHLFAVRVSALVLLVVFCVLLIGY